MPTGSSKTPTNVIEVPNFSWGSPGISSSWAERPPWPAGGLQPAQLFPPPPNMFRGHDPHPIAQQTAETDGSLENPSSREKLSQRPPLSPQATPAQGMAPALTAGTSPVAPPGRPRDRGLDGRPLRRKSFRVGGKGCFEPAVLRSHGGTTDPTRQALPSACLGAAVLPGPHEGGGRCRRGWLPGCLIAAWPGDAVEAFAWYNRPLQHSPGILP